MFDHVGLKVQELARSIARDRTAMFTGLIHRRQQLPRYGFGIVGHQQIRHMREPGFKNVRPEFL